jgi:hypothetical protein
MKQFKELVGDKIGVSIFQARRWNVAYYLVKARIFL